MFPLVSTERAVITAHEMLIRTAEQYMLIELGQYCSKNAIETSDDLKAQDSVRLVDVDQQQLGRRGSIVRSCRLVGLDSRERTLKIGGNWVSM